MMNMLYDDPAKTANLAVQAFPYDDTNGAPVRSPLYPVEPAGPRITNPEKSPGITQEEISRLVSEAHAEGAAQGRGQASALFAEEVARERQRVFDAVQEFQKERADYFAKVELELVHLALAIAAKILHRESQIDRMVVAGLVKVMIEKLQQNTKVVVRVRPEESESWKRYFVEKTDLQILPDASLEPRACLLETELGVANMALDAQLKEVEQGFFDLLAQRPQSK